VAPKQIALSELAASLGLEVEGDPDVVLSGVAALDGAGPGDLSFIRSARFLRELAASGASAVIALPGVDLGGRPALRSDDPSRDFYRAARLLVPPEPIVAGVDATARVAPDAKIDPTASVGAHCALGRGAVVGARSVLHAGVVLYDGARVGADCVLHARCVVAASSELGDRVVLQPGVVIGGAGFGFVGGEDGGLHKAYDLGRVVVEDDVEIGANTTIDRGTLGETRIGRGTKIDNLVQIGHNCRIGANVTIVAQVGLAGSVRVEDGAFLLGQAGIPGHLTIGAGALVGAQAGVTRDVAPNARVFGLPAREGRAWHKESAALARLPGLLKRVRALEKWVEAREADAGAPESRKAGTSETSDT
jgi:UDP-3-O-[3-hydroxymyristoyl] glucosamine N-acyltransferase